MGRKVPQQKCHSQALWQEVCNSGTNPRNSMSSNVSDKKRNHDSFIFLGASTAKLLTNRLVLPSHPGLHAQSFIVSMDFNILRYDFFIFIFNSHSINLIVQLHPICM